MRVVESQYSLSFAVVKGEGVVEAVRPGRVWLTFLMTNRRL